MKFHLGLGKFFSPLEKSHRAIMRQVVHEKYGIHYASIYSGSDYFFRALTSKSERNNIEVIVKVPCHNIRLLKSEIDFALKTLDINVIDVIQLWGGDEIFDSFNKESLLFRCLENLKKTGKIKNFVPQLYHDQTKSLLKKNIFSTPIAFYGSPYEIDIDPEVLDKINLQGSIAMHIFQGGQSKADLNFKSHSQRLNWQALRRTMSINAFSLTYLDSLSFVERAVGSTRNEKHFTEIVNFFNKKVPLSASKIKLVQEVALINKKDSKKIPQGMSFNWPSRQSEPRRALNYCRSLFSFHIIRIKIAYKFSKFLKLIPRIFPDIN